MSKICIDRDINHDVFAIRHANAERGDDEKEGGSEKKGYGGIASA